MTRKNLYSVCTLMVKTLIAALFLTSTARAQMRQIFKDDLAPNNVIHKISFFSPSTGYVAFKDWIGFTTDSGRTFTRKYITLSNVNYNGYSGVNLTFGFGINGVKAFDQNTIIVYGDYGLVPAILRSTDGGNTFLLVYHSLFFPYQFNSSVNDMVFPGNGNTGLAVDADRILRSTDKGITWTVSYSDLNRHFTALNVIDNNTVFAVATSYSPALFFKTFDAGASWTYTQTPVGNVKSLYFITATKGWVNVDDKIFYTSNGGSSWIQKNSAAATPITAYTMKFVNDNTGYALSDAFEVYKTTDSGRIWEPVARDNNFTYLGYTHNDLQVWDNDQLWAGGGHGLLELNTNSSVTPLPGAFFDIDTAGMWVANVVQLTNYSKTNYTYEWIVNGVTVGTSYHASYVHDIYLAADTVKLVVSDGSHSDTTEKIHYFNAVPYPPPLVNTFLPASGGPGTQVTITGKFFSHVTGVSFGGIPASSYTVLSLTQIIAVVGPGGNGSVTITSATGTGFKPGFIIYPPPVITSLSPLFAPMGATVTITGSNFSATPAENIVLFGGVKATVLTAAPGQLTVQVPAGTRYAPVSVTVNNHIGYSMQWFSVTFPATCGLTGYSFERAKVLPGNNTITYHATLGVADIDGDGRNDIVVPYRYGTHILQNKSNTGSIDFVEVPVNDKVQTNSDGTGVADLDGDGKPDLVTANYWSNLLEIYKNTSSVGSISFAAPDTLRHPGGPRGMYFQDLDGDGKQDMIINIQYPNLRYISVYRNISLSGKIAFEPPLEVEVGIDNDKVSIGDLDGDGKPDLFVGDDGILNAGVYSFTILRNTSGIGSISFARAAVTHYAIPYRDGDLADMDGDGKLDVVVAYDTHYSAGPKETVVIYKNNSTPGNMSFAAVPFNIYNDNDGMALGDLDGDGKLDVCSPGNNGSDLLKNTGSPGTISMLHVNSNNNYILGGGTNGTIIDLDNDSRPDILFGGSVVYRNILEPGALAGKDTTICLGQSVKLGHYDAHDHTYAWTSSPAGFSSTLANPVVSPAVSTDYYIEVTNPFGCVTKDTVRITVGGPAPLVNAGPNATICTGSRQIGMTGDAANTYSWTSIPAGFTSNIPDPVVTPTSVQTDYILTVNTGACVAKDTVTIIRAGLPTANAGPDRNVCYGNGTSIGVSPIGSYTYSWTSNPAGYTSNQANPIVYTGVTTTYYLEVTASQGGCKAYDTVQIQVNIPPPVPTVTVSGPLSFCQGGSVTLTSSAATGNEWLNNGSVMQGITTQSITVTQSGSYTVRNANGLCYSYSTPVVVTVSAISPTPQITASGNTTICQGSSVVLTSSATQGNQWSKDGVSMPGITTQAITVTQSGSYVVSTTNGNCGTNSTPVVVTVNAVPPAPQITVTGNTTFCNGSSVLFTSSVAQGNQWYINGTAISGAGGNQFRTTGAGTYTLRYTSNGCLSPASAAIIVQVTTPPPTPMIIQTGNTLVSSADAGNQWYLNNVAIPGAVAKTWQPVTTGVYTVSVTEPVCPPAFSMPFNYTITAINEPAWGNSMIISPNPTEGDVAIRYTGNSTSFTAMVLDVNGRQVKTQGLFWSSCTLDLRKLNAGMYVVKVFNTMTKEYINRVIVKL